MITKVALVCLALAAAACGGRTNKIEGAAGGGVGAPAPKPLAVKPMTGPFAGISEYCAAALEEFEAEDPDSDVACGQIDCDCDDPGDCEEGQDCDDCEDAIRCADLMGGASLPSSATALAAPFESAVFVAVGFVGPDCRLLVETEQGWFGSSIGMCGSRDNRSEMALTVLEVTVRDLFPGGSPELLLRLREAETFSNMDNDGVHSETVRETQVVCGLGPSGRPSCVEPLAIKERWSVTRIEDVDVDPEMAAQAPEPGSGEWERKLEYAADALVVSGGGAERVGRHPIAFP